MQIGLVGPAGSGKTTVFNAVTGLDAPVGGVGGDRTKPNLGVTKVPDPRVDILSGMYDPKKTIHAEVTFVDLPGKMPGSAKDGLDPKAVQHIRDMDGLAIVLRDFENPALADPPDLLRDLALMEDELLLTDHLVVEGRLDRLRREQKKTPELAVLRRCVEALEEGSPLRLLDLSPEEEHLLSGFRFLTLKPGLVLLSSREDDAGADPPAALVEAAAARGLSTLAMSGQVEMEIAGLDPEDQSEFLADLGLSAGASARFVRAAWDLLDRICFLTVGPDEVRAWEIRAGLSAVKAAGKVHSDIERGFIRAEVIAYEDLIEHGSEAACKDVGKMRLEGKGYIVQDGDVMHYRFNV
jgi:GTP-binding protein YchF